jgi:hypothetical protein
MDEDYDLYGQRRPLSPDITFAAWAWLTQPPPEAAGTEPVIAIVATLLEILTDRQQSDQEKFDALRRAVRLLNAFANKENARADQTEKPPTAPCESRRKSRTRVRGPNKMIMW